MGIEDEIAELEAKIAAEEGNNQPDQDEDEHEQAEEAKLPEETAELGEESADERPADGEEPAEKKKTPSDYAKERKAKAAERKAERDRIAELEAEVARLRQQPQQPQPETKRAEPANTDPEPDRQTHYEEWLEWKDRKNEERIALLEQNVGRQQYQTEAERKIGAAIAEVESLSAQKKTVLPDIDDARQHLVNGLSRSYRIAGVSQDKIDALVNRKIIEVAALAQQAGHDPIEALYDFTINELGYEPRDASPKDDVSSEDAKQPDMRRLADNRSRNAGTAAARGRGGKSLTLQEAVSMSTEEWARLPKAEQERLMRMA